MKKFLKNNIKLILVFLLGIIVSSGITAYAVNNYMSEQIRYQNNTFAINSVSEALDDLYSYSKEKIDNNTSNNYSTEEQVVGTWIDGKPLYQKTFIITNPSDTYNLNLNIDKIATIGGVYLDSTDNSICPITWNHPNYSGQYGSYVFYYNNSLQFRTVGSTRSSLTYYITLQYTKTTDTATS